jgi:hypothetical protein
MDPVGPKHDNASVALFQRGAGNNGRDGVEALNIAVAEADIAARWGRDDVGRMWTAARVARGQAEVIPAVTPRDDFGLPMEMAM